MPLYDLQCPKNHRTEVYLPTTKSKSEYWTACDECGYLAEFVISRTKPSTYFRESRGTWIHNLGDQPVYITSAEQHRREMKKAGVDFATPKRGEKGCWV